MSENVLKNVRIVHKHDIEENWLKATNFIPKKGELIIYDEDNNYTYERMKIGDGYTRVSELPFSNDWDSLENKPFGKLETNLFTITFTDSTNAILNLTAEEINKYDYSFSTTGELVNQFGVSANVNIDFIGFVEAANQFRYNITISCNVLKLEGSSSFHGANEFSSLTLSEYDNLSYGNSPVAGDVWTIKIDNFFVLKDTPIDENYIPDTIARKEDIPEQITKISELENDTGYLTELPEEVLKYSEQYLEEVDQMQARKNLGLYHSYEEDITEQKFKYTYVGWWEVIEDNLSSIVSPNQSYIVQFLNNEYKVETKSKSTSIPNNIVNALLWIGNPSLINADDISYDLSDEQDYRDLPFVIYWHADDYGFEGVNPTIAIDSNIIPNMGQGLTVYSSSIGEIIYEQIPEEFIPDTIARTEEIKSYVDSFNSTFIVTIDSDNIADKTWQEVFEARQQNKIIILKDDMGLYYSYFGEGYDYSIFTRVDSDRISTIQLRDWDQTVSKQSIRLTDMESFNNHAQNKTIHITEKERENWNNASNKIMIVKNMGDGTSSHTASEIHSASHNGSVILFQEGDQIYQLDYAEVDPSLMAAFYNYSGNGIVGRIIIHHNQIEYLTDTLATEDYIDNSNPIIIVTQREDDYTKATLTSQEIYDLRDEGKTLIFKDSDMIYYLNYSEIDPTSEATFISWWQERLYVKKVWGDGRIEDKRIEFAKASDVVTQIADVESALYNAIVENDIEDKAYVDEKIAAIPQSDWNQNNETAQDFIKNKPFGEEYSNIYYLEEQTVNIEEHSDLHQVWIDIPLNDLVYRNNKYTVVFDGIEYEATLYDEENGAFIGINYYYPSDNRDNLPFGLWFSQFASKDNELYGLSQLAGICATDDSLIGEHTISIYAEGLKINKIDEKYLPNSVLDISELKDEISGLNSDLKEIVEVLPSKMDKENPTGSGSLSMNGKAGATIGNYSTVLGNNSMSVGESSIVSGHEVVSNNNYQSVFGKYNKYTTPYESVEETTAPMDISYSTPILVANSYIFDPFTGLFKLESPITATIGSGGRYVNCYTSETDGWVEYVKRILSSSINAGYRAGRKIYSKATENNVNYALMIGNGQSDEERSNAHTLDWDGNAWFSGDVYVGSTSGTNKDEGSKKLATEEYVDEQITAIPKDAFKINITLTDNVYSADKTGVEIKAAIDAGNFVYAYFNNEIYYVTHCKDANIHFQYQKVALTGITSKLFACVIATDRWAYGEANIDLRTANLTTNHKSTIIGAINEVNSNKANQTDLDALEDLVGTTSVQSQITSAIADLVDTAPDTLNTLGELATAIQENDSIIDTLDAAITNKADKTEVEALKTQVTATSLILADAITGQKYEIQIQNGQLVSFPVEE